MFEEDESMLMKILKVSAIVLACIFLSPLLLCFLCVYGVYKLSRLFLGPKDKREYYESAYYRDLQLPYKKRITKQDSYIFYNRAKEMGLDFEFVCGEGDGADYIASEKEVFLFPKFDQIGYDDVRQHWKVDRDGEWTALSRETEDCRAKLRPEHFWLDVNFLVTRDMLVPRDIVSGNFDNVDNEKDLDFAVELLPHNVRLGDDFISAYTDATK